MKRIQGQALITLLIFMVVASSVTTMAVMVLINTTRASSISGSSLEAKLVSESGMENGIIRLIRDTAYTGETLAVGQGSAVITVSTNGNVKSLQSIGTLGNYTATTNVTATYIDNVLTITTWTQSY